MFLVPPADHAEQLAGELARELSKGQGAVAVVVEAAAVVESAAVVEAAAGVEAAVVAVTAAVVEAVSVVETAAEVEAAGAVEAAAEVEVAVVVEAIAVMEAAAVVEAAAVGEVAIVVEVAEAVALTAVPEGDAGGAGEVEEDREAAVMASGRVLEQLLRVCEQDGNAADGAAAELAQHFTVHPVGHSLWEQESLEAMDGVLFGCLDPEVAAMQRKKAVYDEERRLSEGSDSCWSDADSDSSSVVEREAVTVVGEADAALRTRILPPHNAVACPTTRIFTRIGKCSSESCIALSTF